MHVRLTIWTAVLVGVLAGTGMAATHPADTEETRNRNGVLHITGSMLGTVKTYTKENTGGTSDWKGGLGMRIIPTDTPSAGNSIIRSITGSNFSVSGYNTTIKATGSGAGNAYGPLVVSGLANGNKSVVTLTTLSGVGLRNNTTTFIMDSGYGGEAPSGFGGAGNFASVGSLTYRNSHIAGNNLVLELQSITPKMVHGNGGGIALRDQFTASHRLESLRFSDNTVLVRDDGQNPYAPLDGTAARGGALFVQNTNDEYMTPGTPDSKQTGTDIVLHNVTFSNNEAKNAINGGLASGGAVAFDMAVRGDFNNVTFTGNRAVASGTGGKALGGALRLELRNRLNNSFVAGELASLGKVGTDPYHTRITNTTFTGNYAAGDNALGGAIYTQSNIAMSGVTFKGNYTAGKDGSNSVKNAIHLAAPLEEGSNYDNLIEMTDETVVFFTDRAGSASYDYDGISSDNEDAVIAKTGNGDLYLYGEYENFKGELSLEGGSTYFKGGQTFGTNGGDESGLMVLENRAVASLAKDESAGIVKFDQIGFGATGGTLVVKHGSYFQSTKDIIVLEDSQTNNRNDFRIYGSVTEGVPQYFAKKDGYNGTDKDYLLKTGRGLYNDYDIWGAGTYDSSSSHPEGPRYVYEAIWADVKAASRTLASYASSNNAANVGSYLMANGGSLKDYMEEHFDAGNAGEINRLLSLASGENHAAINASAASFGRYTLGNMAGQAMTAWRSAPPTAGGFPAARPRGAYGSLRGAPLAPASRVWAHVDGYYQRGDDSGANRAKTRGWNVSVGVDRLLGEWLVGGGFQYGDNRMKISGLGSKTDYDVLSFALYGGRRVCFSPGTLYLNAGLLGSVYDFEADRHDGLGGSYAADYSGSGFGAFLDASFAMRLGSFAELQPFANLSWSSFWNEDYAEAQTGGVGNALRVDSDHQGNLYSTLGLRAKTDIAQVVSLDGNVGWRHAYGTVRPTSSVGFIGVGGTYAVRGSALARDELVYGGGITVRPTRNTAVRLSYDGSLGDGSVTHRGNLDFSLAF